MGNENAKAKSNAADAVSKNEKNDRNALERSGMPVAPAANECNIPDQDLGPITIKGDVICQIYKRYN
jgi:hypothetical protein